MAQRIGIMTFHYSFNYGAVLQAYGLCKAIRDLGHSPQVIDYRPKAARHFLGQWGIRSRTPWSTLVRKLRFRWFIARQFPLTPRRYWDEADFRKHPPECDVLVCGSDQPWNIQSSRGFDRPFFLDFLHDAPVGRISYAPSFGLTRDLGPHRDEIARLLSKFDAISVRDRPSAAIVRELTGREPCYVMDPCFLTDFDEITDPRPIKNDYLLVYASPLTKEYRQMIQGIARSRGLRIVSVRSGFPGGNVAYRAAGIPQWLRLFRDARFICTNYFHGTVFSIKFMKPFLLFPRHGNESRMIDLIERCGLSNRYVAAPSDHMDKGWDDAVDYDAAAAGIAQAIDVSRRYLKSAIEQGAGN